MEPDTEMEDFLGDLLRLHRDQKPPDPLEVRRKREAAHAEQRRRGFVIDALRLHRRGHAFSKEESCFRRYPQYPQIVGPDNYDDAKGRDELRERASSRTYAMYVGEHSAACDRWVPWFNSTSPVLKPWEDGDQTAWHFINAYRAAVHKLFGITIRKAWAPLTPQYASGVLNQNDAKFREFIGNFCRQGLVFPHGWILHRLSSLWRYGRLRDLAIEGTLDVYLKKYGTFLHVLDGGGATTKPPVYQSFHKTKHHFYNQERPYTTRGLELWLFNGKTVSTICDTDVSIHSVADAQQALENYDFATKLSDLVKLNRDEATAHEVKMTRAVKNGKWAWSWPMKGGYIREEMREFAKGPA